MKRLLSILAPGLLLLLVCSPFVARADGWQTGTVSWYGRETCPPQPRACLTATGEPFDPDGHTAAAADRRLLGATYTVANPANGTRVVVRVNDVCPSCAGLRRTFDLSRGAMAALGGIQSGVLTVRYAAGVLPAEPPPSVELLSEHRYWDADGWVLEQAWLTADGRVVVTWTVEGGEE